MSRALTAYVHKQNPERGALASEITPDDVGRGRGGKVGDFYVMEPGYRPQWTERGAFLDEWEKLSSPDAVDLDPAFRDEARTAIDALEPAAAIATRDAFSSSDSVALYDVAAVRKELGHLDEREALLLRLIGASATNQIAELTAELVSFRDRLTALEQVTIESEAHVRDAIVRLEALEKSEPAVDVDAQPDTAAAGDGRTNVITGSTASSSRAAPARKRRT